LFLSRSNENSTKFASDQHLYELKKKKKKKLQFTFQCYIERFCQQNTGHFVCLSIFVWDTGYSAKIKDDLLQI